MPRLWRRRGKGKVLLAGWLLSTLFPGGAGRRVNLAQDHRDGLTPASAASSWTAAGALSLTDREQPSSWTAAGAAALTDKKQQEDLVPNATMTFPRQRLKPALQAPGVFRESHLKVWVLSWLLSIIILSDLGAMPVIGSWKSLPGIRTEAFAVLMCVHVLEGCVCNTLAFLWRISTDRQQLDYIDALLEAAPQVLWKVENYHYETRYVTRWKNGTAYSERTRERVSTSSYVGELRIDSWSDRSHALQDLSDLDLRRYAMTKVRLAIDFDIVDQEHYHQQLSQFRSSHRNDVHQDFTETRQISGFKASTMVCTGPESILASVSVFWLCHLVLPLALPYRMWFSANTGKFEAKISKQIRCSSTVITPHANGHGGMGTLGALAVVSNMVGGLRAYVSLGMLGQSF